MPQREDYRLRSITPDDSARLLTWRNSERVRAMMYTDHLISPSEHQAWFTRIQASSAYQICEFQATPVGLVSFTQIEFQHQRCFWGFYLGETDLPKGTGTAMGFLGLDYAFETLHIRKLCSEVLAFNAASISLHQKLGFQQEGHFISHVLKNGAYQDVLFFTLFRDHWLHTRTELAPLVFQRI